MEMERMERVLECRMAQEERERTGARVERGRYLEWVVERNPREYRYLVKVSGWISEVMTF